MDDQIRRLHGQGLRDPAIAIRLGVSTSHVNRIRHRLRLATHPLGRNHHKIENRAARALHAQGLVDREIAQRLGVSRELVQKWRARNGLPPNGWHKTTANKWP
jgi:transposase